MSSNASQENTTRHIACGCCRRRKLRCDGKRPTCGTCRRLKQVCEYSDVVRKAGPKRGYVRSLESRVAQLERMLSDYNIKDLDQPQDNANLVSLNLDEAMPPPEFIDELTEIFFRTFNVMLPLIDRNRYLLSMKLAPSKQPRPFLQYAIMTTVAASEPRYRRFKSILYTRARKYLHRAENFRHLNGAPSVGFIQAWCLLAHFELREGLVPQGWISVGKAHRAMSLMSLHAIDGQNFFENAGVHDTVETAEHRRAFWFVYLCDRWGAMASSVRALFHLDDVYTRVPMDDAAYLSGRYDTPTCALEDLMRQPALFGQFPNSHLAYLIAISETCYSMMELGLHPKKSLHKAPREWMTEYQKLESSLTALLAHIPKIPPAATIDENETDPVVIARAKEDKHRRTTIIMVNVMGQAGHLILCRTGLYGIQSMPILLPLFNTAELLKGALMAMLDILLITRNPHDISVISAHPLHVFVLFAVSVLLLALAEHDLVAIKNFQAPLAYMLETLHQMQEDMPLTSMLYAFLIDAMSRHQNDTVKSLDDVMAGRQIEIVIPNFFDKWTGGTAEEEDDARELDRLATSPQARMDGASPSDNGRARSAFSASSTSPSDQGSVAFSPGNAPTADSSPSAQIKQEPGLTLDFATALEFSKALPDDVRNGLAGNAYYKPTGSLKLDIDGEEMSLQENDSIPDKNLDVTAAFSQSVLDVSGAMFEDPPDMMPDTDVTTGAFGSFYHEDFEDKWLMDQGELHQSSSWI